MRLPIKVILNFIRQPIIIIKTGFQFFFTSMPDIVNFFSDEKSIRKTYEINIPTVHIFASKM